MVGAGTDEERAGRLIGAPEVHDTGAAARRRCGQTAREIVDEARGEVGWIGVCEEPGSLKPERQRVAQSQQVVLDRKSTRLNSSHRTISYAVFCLKKKKQ